MVASAQKRLIVEPRLSAIHPFDGVVDIAEAGGHPAPGESAVLVANFEGAPHGLRQAIAIGRGDPAVFVKANPIPPG